MTPPIHRELTNHQYLLAELKKRFPDEDESDLAEALEGETNLTEALARLLRSAQWDVGMANGARSIVDDLMMRIERYEARASKKRVLAQNVMERASVRKFEAPDMTVSLVTGRQKVYIVDEQLIPDEYVKPTYTPMKALIKEALEAGKSVPGAELSNQPDTLSVRTK